MSSLQAQLLSPPVNDDAQLLVLFGTQTGKAKAYAMKISMEARERHWPVTTVCMNQVQLSLLKAEKEGSLFVVLVTSSFGCGGPPDSAVIFDQLLKSAEPSEKPFRNILFATLGLGHSAWPSFCGFSRYVDRRFEELGAVRLVPCGDCDDSVGTDQVAAPWMQNLWKFLPRQRSHSVTTPDSVDLEDMGTIKLRHQCMECDCYVDNSHEKKLKSKARSKPWPLKPTAEEDGSECVPLNLPSALRDGPISQQPERASQKRKISKTGYTRCPIELKFLDECDLNTSVDSRRDSVDSDSVYLTDAEIFARLGTHMLPVTDARYLSSDTDRRVVHVELSTESLYTPEKDYLSGSEDADSNSSENTTFRFEPGDDVGVHCCNDAAVVTALLERIGVQNPDQVFTIGESPNAWTSFRDSIDMGNGAVVIDNDSTSAQSIEVPQMSPLSSPGTGARPLNRQGSASRMKMSRRKVAVCDHIRTPCSLRQAFTFFCDVNTPPPACFYAMLAGNTSDSVQRQRLQDLANSSTEEAIAYISSRPNLMDILTDFSSCSPPTAELLYHLPPLAARFYSISNSPFVTPGKVQFAVSVSEFTTPACSGMEKKRKGLCSSWLEQHVSPLLAGTNPTEPLGVPVFLRSAKEFIIPPCDREPLFLIGPGTGLAPFRSFLQHFDGIRRGIVDRGEEDGSNDEFPPVWVIHGCRRKSDALYMDELESLRDRHVVKKLLFAYSREPTYDSPKYVQHVISRHGASIWEDLGREVRQMQQDFVPVKGIGRCVLSGRVYVCGDISRMMKDLHQSFCDLCVLYGGMNRDEAVEQLDLMSREGRFVLGAWSTT